MIARRVSANSRMDFNIGVLSRAAECDIAEKDRAVDGDRFAALHAVEDLIVVVLLQPDP
jgi:hypothetical protein